MVEDLPDHFVPRPDECEKLITCLFDERREEPVAITAALRGAGGYGKTTLAKAVCHDERIQEAFHDGILWVTLGQQPDVVAGLTKLYAALTGERPAFVDIEDAANTLAQSWHDRAYLVVIDDVWNRFTSDHFYAEAIDVPVSLLRGIAQLFRPIHMVSMSMQ